ncbi:MAG: chitobiase/beta-hexosaminidase C-terminal domain-containing protein, partial [bacterium]|nr:chitobiase/beta-hexosaminidase C-terminal domain-containing protein [bacterium]
MKGKLFVLCAAMGCGVNLLAASLCSGNSVGVAIDTTSGTRKAALTEKIRYSPRWQEDGDSVKVTCERVVVDEQQATGLVHRWSFNGSLEDSVGGQTAAIIGDVSMQSDRCVLKGGARGTSYVSLGSNVLPADADGATIEIWATQQATNYWSRVFDFGQDNTTDFMMSWTFGEYFERNAVNVRGANTGDVEGLAPFEVGVEYHISVVIKKLGQDSWSLICSKRDATTGRVLNSITIPTAGTVWSLATQNQVDCWLGCSHWDDPDAAASYNEVRVWNRALTQSELDESARRGPDNLTRTIVTPVAEAVEIVPETLEPGTVAWTPIRNGMYRLTHQAMSGGLLSGESLTALFAVEGLNPENPVITPVSGTPFDTSLTVTMTCPSEGATIYYTTDGSEPTLESSLYKRGNCKTPRTPCRRPC